MDIFFFTIGMAGFKHDNDFNVTKPAMWSCVDMVHYGFSTFQFANETHMHGRFINAGFNETTYDTGNSTVIDDWWLVRDPAQVAPNSFGANAKCIKTTVPTWAPTPSPSGYPSSD